MTYVITSGVAGMQPIATNSATRNHPIGKIVTAVDPTYGEGEFIYLKGVVGTVAGLMVGYGDTTGLTALTSTSGFVNRGQPLAVAMAATVAGEYGWYQISGAAVILKTAVKVDPVLANVGMNVHLSATAGRVMQTSAAARQVVGARFAAATTVTSTTSTAVVTLNRPVQQGKFV